MPAYILTAAVGAPVLVQLGVPILAAHLFVMYYACVSTITPPVAFAAYAAAGIAKSDPNATGWQATRLGLVAYIIPFMFVTNPHILFVGAWYEILAATVMGFCSAWALAACVNSNYHPLLRVALGGACIVVLSHGWGYQALGVAAITAIVLIQRAIERKKEAGPREARG